MLCEDCRWFKDGKCAFQIPGHLLPTCSHKHVRMVDRKELSLIQKIRIRLLGPKKAFNVVVNKEKGEPLEYYYAYCKKHGYFISRPEGWEKELRCPLCWLELIQD